MHTAPKRKKNFAWYKDGKRKGINDIVNSLIRNPHYNLEKTIEICLNYKHCNDLSLLSGEDRQKLRVEILNCLKDRIKQEKQNVKKNILSKLEELKSSIENEIEYAKENEDYTPSLDKYDMRDVKDIDNMEYEIIKLEELYRRLKNEILS